jgi:hypothetical protein
MIDRVRTQPSRRFIIALDAWVTVAEIGFTARFSTLC